MRFEEYATIIESIKPEQAGNTPEWKAFWQKNIELSQQVTRYEIEGEEYQRIPYGSEPGHEEVIERADWTVQTWKQITHDKACHDCAVTFGQLHVPGCDVEECPKCHGQAISCGCADEEEDEDEDEESEVYTI